MDWASASEIARAVANGQRSALSVTEAALTRIKRLNPKLNAFTDVSPSGRDRRPALSIGRGAKDSGWGLWPAFRSR